MKALKRSLALLLVIPMIVGVMAVAKPAEAMVNNSLGDLIVTNGLFTGYNANDLAGLIAVDSITGSGGSMVGTSDLSDLIVLDGLFGWGGNANDLAGLIVVDNIYNSGF